MLRRTSKVRSSRRSSSRTALAARLSSPGATSHSTARPAPGGAGLAVTRSASVTGSIGEKISWKPSERTGPTSRPRLILAGAATSTTASAAGAAPAGIAWRARAHAAASQPSSRPAPRRSAARAPRGGSCRAGRGPRGRAARRHRVSGAAPCARGPRQRVDDLLAPLAERRAHERVEHEPHRRPAAGRLRAKVTKAESTRGGGAKTRARHGPLRLELAGELDQHRHGRVGLGARHREEPLGELALEHDGPAPHAGQRGDRAHEQRHGDVVGEVGHHGGRRRIEVGEPVAQAVDQVEAQVVAAGRQARRGRRRSAGRSRRRARSAPARPGARQQAVARRRPRARRRRAARGPWRGSPERALVDQVVLAVAAPAPAGAGVGRAHEAARLGGRPARGRRRGGRWRS